MNFLRRVKQRTASPDEKSEQQLMFLYNLVRKHGDEILSGKTKLSLTTPILIILNGSFQKLTEGLNQPCFQVANIGNETKQVQLVSFLFEFMQKVVSLKLISGPHSLDCPLLNVDCFKSLQVLEVRKFPIIYLKNLNCIRRQLKALTCFRSTNSFKEVINSFGKETDELYTLPVLKSLDLSYNTIEGIEDASLRLLPSLEILNVSFNCIKSGDSSFLPPVTNLNLGFNQITTIPILIPKVCHSLTSLILRNNNLSTLKGLEALCNLKLLDVAANCIVEISDLNPLAYLQKLLNLSLLDNPISFNPNYVHCTVRKLSPVKRNGKIILDGQELEEAVLQYLGQDVQPISLVSYIPEKPLGVPRGSLLNLISSLPKLATSLPTQESTPIQNGRIKPKAHVREATILDYTGSPVMTGYENDDVSCHSHTSSRSSYSDKMLDINNPITGNLFSSRRSSLTNSLIWVNTSTGTEMKQNEGDLKSPVVDYATWPIQQADQHLSEVLLSESDVSLDKVSDCIGNNVYGNQSELSLTTLEQTINSSPTDDAVVISVVSSDDVHDGDDDSNKSISSLLSDCADTDCTYLVQNIKRSKSEEIEAEEHLFLIFKLPYILEKNENGKLINKLDLNYLRDVKPSFNQLTMILTFDLMRMDWQYREYVFEEKEHLNSFMDNVQPIAVKNYQRKISEMKHCECLKCASTFLMNEECFEGLHCPECGSTMIIDKNENVQQTATKNDVDNHVPFASTSSFGKDESRNFFSVTSIEIENLINESLPDELTKSNDESTQYVSSWPPYKSIIQNRFCRKCNSLPSLRYDQCVTKKQIEDENSRSSGSRKISIDSKYSRKSETRSGYDTDTTESLIPTTKTMNSYPKYPISSASSICSGILQEFSTLKSDDIVPGVSSYLKCDHRLKLYLSLSVYQHEDEEFVCQFRCSCLQYNEIQEYDCLLNISNKSFYLFSVTDSDSDEPENRYMKEAVCSLDSLKFVYNGYYNQSFTFEFSKPGCFYKFLTRNSMKTNEIVNLLKDEFEKLECFNVEKPTFIRYDCKQYLMNIRRQIFGIPEEMNSMGERIYDQIIKSKANLLKSQKIRLRTHHQCFVACELIDWLLAHREVKSRTEGVQICNQLLQIGFIFHVLSKQDAFSDNNVLYKFSQIDTKAAVPNYDVENDLLEKNEMNTSVELYSLAYVMVAESDSTFHERSLIITPSHVFLVNESHQWPLPNLHPPPPSLRDHFSVKAIHKITDVTALEFFEDAPCYVNICFVEEDTPLSGETNWLIRTESTKELQKIVELVKLTWESLFLIELKIVTNISVTPLLECY